MNIGSIFLLLLLMCSCVCVNKSETKFVSCMTLNDVKKVLEPTHKLTYTHINIHYNLAFFRVRVRV